MVELAFVYTALTSLVLTMQVKTSQGFSLPVRHPQNVQEAVLQVGFYYRNIPKNE